MTDIEKLKELLAKATLGPWEAFEYDCGDVSWYDHNGPCPGIFAPDQDCGIVHWDGFKQQYWSSANGNQKQIEANAALIVAAVNTLPELLDEVERLQRSIELIMENCKASMATYKERIETIHRITCAVLEQDND